MIGDDEGVREGETNGEMNMMQGERQGMDEERGRRYMDREKGGQRKGEVDREKEGDR